MPFPGDRLLASFLDAYVHPACAIQLADVREANSGDLSVVQPVWKNAAFKALLAGRLPSGLVDLIHGVVSYQRSGHIPDSDIYSVTSRHWTFTVTVVDEFLIITAAPRQYIEAQDTATRSSTQDQPHQSSPLLMTLAPDLGVDRHAADLWSRTQMGQLILTHRWDATPLGPIGSWSKELIMLVTLTLDWPERLCLWLGGDSIALYNDQYTQVLGPRKSINMLGRTYREVYPEFYDEVADRITAARHGQRTYVRDGLLLMNRERPEADEHHWGLEETYHNWSYTPLWIGGIIVGFVSESVETTSTVITERRMATIHGISLMSDVTTRDAFYDGIFDELARNERDFPFVVTFTVKKATKSKRGRGTSPTRLTLHRKIGVPDDHVFAPASIEMTDGRNSSSDSATASASRSEVRPVLPESPLRLIWPFAECLESGEAVLVSSLGAEAEKLDPRSWNRNCRSAVVIPVGIKDEQQLVVVLGLNPCRPFDATYLDYIKLLQAAMTTGLTTVTNIETAVIKAEVMDSLDRAKTVFFGNVTHELRTPLQLILAPVEDLLSDSSLASNSSAQSRLKVVLRHGRRLLQLVNSLLDFARLEAGRFLASFRPIDLSELTANIASLFRSAIERGGVQFVVDCAAGPNVFVDVDAWEKVVTNIISNAFKYTLNGHIEVRVRYTKSYAKFSCADTGVGIPQADIENIFERFHRVENTGGRTIEGTGVGLALTAETVKSLGGAVDVRSEVGVGSTFTISLPLGSDHIPAERLLQEDEPVRHGSPLRGCWMNYSTWMAEEAHGWVASEPSLASSREMAVEDSNSSGGRSSVHDPETLAAWTLLTDDEREKTTEGSTIVICDDNTDLREYCASIFRERYKVIEFSNGEAALQYVVENPVDLIVSDVHMPVMDGYELLRHIRTLPATTLIPLILFSAVEGIDENAKALNAGADDFLVKPFTSRDLRNRAKRQLLVGGMRRDLEAQVQSRTHLLVESEKQLLERIQESERMRRQQEIVVDLTSHEIRNPLNAIWQNADLIASVLERLRTKLVGQPIAQLLKDGDDAVQSILLSVVHQARIADDVLDFSKLTVNLLTLHHAPFPLHDTVQEVLGWWDLEIRERDITVDLESAEGLRNQWIVSDSQRVSQVLINFLMNAIRFTSEATTRRITVLVEMSDQLREPNSDTHRVIGLDGEPAPGSWLTIAIRDSGSGLSPDERTKLFERFAQAHPSKDQFTGGHGLGLFISRQITHLLGGVIDVESVKGMGSTFSFSIPVTMVGKPLDSERQAASRGHRPSGAHPWKTRPASKRTTSEARHILVVEDNIVNQKVLTRQLQSRGFRVTAAGDGQEALNLMLAPNFDGDLVLMDVEMPIKDGRTACRELRQWEEIHARPTRLPLIAVTGNAREEQIHECLTAGFDRVATKPYKINDLVATIDLLLGHPSA